MGYTCGCVTCLGFGKDRESLFTNVEVMDEEIIKVLGEECRERGLGNTGIWGERAL